MTAPTELIYRRFESRDLDAAGALVAQSGWNQTADDWRIFLDLGEVIAVENPHGQVIATAAVLPHGPALGWVSMVLVDTANRRQGIATRLLRECIERLRRAGRAAVLDATPAGREVYLRLGFRDGWGITRWDCDQARAPASHAARDSRLEIRPIDERDWPGIARLDRAAFGADRTALLRRLHERSVAFARVALDASGVAGFVLGRDGRRATYVGPIVACSEASAVALLEHALAAIGGPVFIDTVDGHTQLVPILQRAGFRVQRPYTRMALGAIDSLGDVGTTYAIAGPELG